MPNPQDRTEPRLFVADDNAIFRRTLIELLGDQHFRVVGSAGDGLSAAHWIESHPEAVDVVLTDEQMPLMTGTRLIERIAARHPHLRFVLLTGSVPSRTIPGVEVHGKPVDARALERTLRHLGREIGSASAGGLRFRAPAVQPRPRVPDPGGNPGIR
jgi:CheY-like chemotaxis protein